MLIEQIETIKSGTSKIARMKLLQGTEINESPVIREVNEMFGGNSTSLNWHWFVPTPVVFPSEYRDEIMGYEYHASWHGEIYMEDDDDTKDIANRLESVHASNEAIDLHDTNTKELTVKKRPSSRLDLEDESSLV